MSIETRLPGRIGWLIHRIIASYWYLAVSAVLSAVPAGLFLLWLDGNGATGWLLDRGWGTVASGETAKDSVAVMAGVNAAFITLYFSITLIVLTMAASNLGVRLIDRWLDRGLTRVSIAGLSFTLIVTLIVLLATDAEDNIFEVPQLSVGAVFVLQAINVAMLSVSLHDLGRTMFVDTSIDRIAQDARSRSLSLVGIGKRSPDWGTVIRAPREGYIESVDLDRLRKMVDENGRARVEAAPGQHVMKGQAILRVEPDLDEDKVAQLAPIGPYRSSNQGVVFHVRLLVEIGARALSPAINDFYTAITCADKLASIMRSQADTWVAPDAEPALECDRHIELPGQDFRGLFDDPLSAFRQAACQYPSVTIRMIGNYGRVAHDLRRHGHSDDGLPGFLRLLARQLADHGASVAQYEHDINDIEKTFDAAFPNAKAGG